MMVSLVGMHPREDVEQEGRDGDGGQEEMGKCQQIAK